MEYKSMGKTIQALRKKKGMTQRELADQLNITDKAVSKWERDVSRPDIDILQQLAMVLDTTVAVLLNTHDEAEEHEVLTAIRSSEKIHDTDEDLNPSWEYYKDRSRQLLQQGVIDFLIGSIGLLIIFLVAIFNAENFNILEIPALLLFAIVCGIFFAGIPYGWQTISKWTNQWIIYGSFLVVLFLFMLKAIGTFAIAMVGYPIALIYNLIRSQKSRKNIKICFSIWIVIGIAYIVFAVTTALSQ